MLFLPATPAPATVRVGNLDLSSMMQEWGKPQRDKSVDGAPLRIGGQGFAFGLGTHAASRLEISLGGRATRFSAKVGVDDEAKANGSVRFRVYADGTLRADSGIVRQGQAAKPIAVDLSGVRNLALETDGADDGIDNDHADWAEAAIETTDARAIRTQVFDQGPASELAPVDRVRTRVNGPALLGGTPGRPFLYRIPASGRRPMLFSADRLPSTLRLDANTGIVTGTVPSEGRYAFTFRASGAGGVATRAVTMVAGERPLPTPLLGWNSWYAHFLEVDAAGVRRAARAMVDSGLADFRFRYVNVDDGWEAETRAANGEIVANAKFPDMRALTDEIHAMGLRAGLYSSPGPKTCGQYLGSYGHEGQDARTWANWGFDLIKYDWCSYGGIAKDNSLAEYQKPYILMGNELKRLDRDLAFSMCQYGMGDVRAWGTEVGGSLWRTTGDVYDSWASVSAIGFEKGGVDAQRGDDPDMLMVGKLLTTGKVAPSRLTPNEQITQVTLWSMRGAPLLLSCDLTQLDGFTQRLLMNPEVLDVDQDLSMPGRKVAGDGSIEVWRRDLTDGAYAIAVFNRGFGRAEVPMTLGPWLPQPVVAYKTVTVRDLWPRRDLSRIPKSVTVPAHGVRLFRVVAR